MADGGMRIDRISPITLDPTAEGRSPLKKRIQEEEQSSPISRKRSREDGELFPQVKRMKTALPEEGAKNIDFNRNSWSSAKPNQETEQKALIATHRNEKKPLQFERVEKDPLFYLPKTGGYYVAQIIGQAYEVHMLVQKNQLEVFKVTQDSVEKLRGEKLELMKQQIANGELQANWSYRGELLQYLGISANFFGGLGLTMAGNPIAGAAMMGGSALTVGAKITQHHTDQKVLAAIMTLGGMALSGYGMSGGLLAALTANDLPGKLATAAATVNKFAEFQVGRKHTEAQAGQRGLQSQTVTNQFKRETEKQEMDKIVGSFAKKEHINTVATAAKLISTEDQIKSNIARGKS